MSNDKKYNTLREKVAEKVQLLRRIVSDTSASDEDRKKARAKLAKYRSVLVEQASFNGTKARLNEAL